MDMYREGLKNTFSDYCIKEGLADAASIGEGEKMIIDIIKK